MYVTSTSPGPELTFDSCAFALPSPSVIPMTTKAAILRDMSFSLRVRDSQRDIARHATTSQRQCPDHCRRSAAGESRKVRKDLRKTRAASTGTVQRLRCDCVLACTVCVPAQSGLLSWVPARRNVDEWLRE